MYVTFFMLAESSNCAISLEKLPCFIHLFIHLFLLFFMMLGADHKVFHLAFYVEFIPSTRIHYLYLQNILGPLHSGPG